MEDLQMHLRTTKDAHSKNEKQEEFAWQRAHQLHKELFKKGHCKDVHKNKTTSEVMSSTEAKNTATVLAMHAKGWGVPGRQWRNVTYEGMTFSESQRKEDY